MVRVVERSRLEHFVSSWGANIAADALSRKSMDGELVGVTPARSDISERIKSKQYEDGPLVKLRDGMEKVEYTLFTVGADDYVLRLQGRLCVPDVDGYTKMYKDLMHHYWWRSMKVKAEHQRPGCLARNIKISQWKWEVSNMDFVVGLQHTKAKFDSIWVIVDRPTRSIHLLHVKMTDTAVQYAKLYLKEIVRLHGIPTSTISDRRTQFTAHLWK
ncbi:uncharacterized protein LOC132061321 [Lycium ferocissimum]|uniref:uncharacterized protein LOC132061321 n=1 Tax=Lycium ferocissimum TaxID=112874 RepID=UPI0028158299|nr:uncharacterized protein LOC132061321 [Lycium ferocissimum]